MKFVLYCELNLAQGETMVQCGPVFAVFGAAAAVLALPASAQCFSKVPCDNSGNHSSYLVEVTNSGTGASVKGRNTSANSSALAVLGDAVSGGTGVSGVAAGNGVVTSVGVSGASSATNGIGVRGSGVKGVEGTGAGNSAVGVAGYAGGGTSTIGVGGANVGTAGIGVYGSCTSSCTSGGYAGYFLGSVNVTGDLNVDGTVTKGSGSFVIDHPLEPANKKLFHSFVESDQMKDIYDGVVVLGKDGQAVVKLPTYFEALNTEFRYQLTCIGSHAPVYVRREIRNNQFEIAGGRAGQRLSWQITGVRDDAFARSHPMQVEVEKSPAERGRYIHPEAFGKTPTLSIASPRNASYASSFRSQNP